MADHTSELHKRVMPKIFWDPLGAELQKLYNQVASNLEVYLPILLGVLLLDYILHLVVVFAICVTARIMPQLVKVLNCLDSAESLIEEWTLSRLRGSHSLSHLQTTVLKEASFLEFEERVKSGASLKETNQRKSIALNDPQSND